MRIAIVASPVTPIGGAQVGGAQSVICDLAQGLARRGHAVQIHCAEGSNLPGVELVTVPVPPGAAAALVLPGGPQPRPTPGVAASIETMFGRIAAHMPDAISVHAFDAPAMRAAATMRALCTLHLPPLVDAVVEGGPLRAGDQARDSVTGMSSGLERSRHTGKQRASQWSL